MVRIGISVEGATEERFIKIMLEPYLSEKEIFVSPISLGGNISVDRIRRELENLAYKFDFVSTFYDFYGFKRKSEDETKETLEAKIGDAIKVELRRKLIPYIQMYEFEALLFSSPEIIASNLKDATLDEWASGILSEFDNNPEEINNSRDTAPSKRLEQKTIYRKTVHGPNITREIGLTRLREMCAGFNAWLQKIENLAV